MARLTIEDVRETKEYLENMQERVWFVEKGLTFIEVDLFDTIQVQYEEIEALKRENEIYKNFTTKLCNMLLEEIDKNGYCRMIVKKDEVDKLLESLPSRD